MLVNSNPATIMTDPDTADATYIEPLTANDREIIAKARCTAADVGRSDGFELCDDLEANGVLEKYGVEMIVPTRQ